MICTKLPCFREINADEAYSLADSDRSVEKVDNIVDFLNGDVGMYSTISFKYFCTELVHCVLA